MFDVPLIQQSRGHYQKVLFHFKKNKDLKDYPAAANYLRKECEQKLKSIMYGKYLLIGDGETGEVKLRTQIGELKVSFDRFMADFNLDVSPFDKFGEIMRTTLNPLSHDNLQKPIYKRELEEAFELIDNLNQIQKVTTIIKGTEIVLEIRGEKTIDVFYKTTEDVYSYTQNGRNANTDVHIKPFKRIEGGETSRSFSNKRECLPNIAYNRIHKQLLGTEDASSTNPNYLQEFKYNGTPLSEIVN